MSLEFFDECRKLTEILEKYEAANITKAAEIVAEGIMNGGITQSFGSGHSYAAALEISGRAGGLIPSKLIMDPAGGMYEQNHGVGKTLMHKVLVSPNDIFFLVSNSGRNPMIIEMAEEIKKHDNKLIVVTALESSKASTSRHESGKLLYEFADVVLDNHSVYGDAALNISGLETKVCGTSSFAATLLLQQTMYEAIKIMVSKGFEPPVYLSANIDGGHERNLKIENQYAERIFHI
ncbi:MULTISPECIES: SIS domain-containing protein [Enterococcus]|uniref:SIS domain-containing protein n=1 Tax=Enterococcus alishanensis TaxID=1303817 RepID=A0ABS6TE98_9ENTE|nr:SIS domain-containing protein [Enterococcus alishanensis]MBV7391229.1 SIS domain-containing protein [Enterococcus alishanensis]